MFGQQSPNVQCHCCLNTERRSVAEAQSHQLFVTQSHSLRVQINHE